MTQQEQSQTSVNGRVKLTGHIDVPEDRLDAVQAALPAHVALTRAEKGCLSFEVIPCPRTQNRFLVSEIFTGQQAFDAHQERTKKSPWAKVSAGIAREYTIEILD